MLAWASSSLRAYGDAIESRSGVSTFLATPPGGVVRDLLPHFLADACGWLALFALLFAASPVLLGSLLPAFRALKPKDRRSYAASLAALPHHFLVVAVALHWLAGAFEPRAVASVLPISLAYLLCDTLWAALPDVLDGDSTYLLHHVLGLAITLSALLLEPSTLRLVPHILICESSTPVFLLGRVARRAGWATLRSACEVAFISLFAATRVVNLPLMAAHFTLTRRATEREYPALQVVMLALCAMQYVWFFGAILPAALGLRGRGAREDSSKRA